MPGKRLPTEVVERARTVAKDRAPVPSPQLSPPRASSPRPVQLRARDKVVAALKRLHPMD